MVVRSRAGLPAAPPCRERGGGRTSLHRKAATHSPTAHASPAEWAPFDGGPSVPASTPTPRPVGNCVARVAA